LPLKEERTLPRKQHPDVTTMTLKEMHDVPSGELVEVRLGLNTRLVLRRTKDGRYVPVHGSCLPVWAVAELAGRSLSAQPAVDRA
jgi:hypothetical protein